MCQWHKRQLAACARFLVLPGMPVLSITWEDTARGFDEKFLTKLKPPRSARCSRPGQEGLAGCGAEGPWTISKSEGSASTEQGETQKKRCTTLRDHIWLGAAVSTARFVQATRLPAMGCTVSMCGDVHRHDPRSPPLCSESLQHTTCTPGGRNKSSKKT